MPDYDAADLQQSFDKGRERARRELIEELVRLVEEWSTRPSAGEHFSGNPRGFRMACAAELFALLEARKG